MSEPDTDALIEDLRKQARDILTWRNTTNTERVIARMLHRAADALAREREARKQKSSECETLRQTLTGALIRASRVERAEAQVEALRKALQWISLTRVDDTDAPYAVTRLVDKANEALASSPPPPEKPE